MLQQSNEWYEARIGKLTASRFADIMGGVEARKRYACEILQEIVTDEYQSKASTEAMLYGSEMERYAVDVYEHETGYTTLECGLFVSDKYPFVGASPDRLIGFDGLLEVKCPYYTYNHVYAIYYSAYDKHKAQVQGQLMVTERDWCDLVSYDPRFTEQPIHVQRIYRDADYIALLETELVFFWQCIESRQLNEIDKPLSKRKS